jgi:hypothetical protein
VPLIAKNPEQTKKVTVKIQNQSPHEETIPNAATLAALVMLNVEALATPNACPNLTATLDASKLGFPVVLNPKKKLNVPFVVTFSTDCIPDPAKTTKDEAHDDYRFTAMVDHSALDGQGDTDPVDDTCPHTVMPPFRSDPNPDGTLKDKGCGKKKADNTFGAEVRTDVVDKR